jgi:mRNA interferase RelE/StbE
VPAHRIDIRARADRALKRLDPAARKAVALVIDNLAVEPRPRGAVPLTGHRSYLRVRSGDYRVIYVVDDRAQVVTIAAVGHRRDIYKRLDI